MLWRTAALRLVLYVRVTGGGVKGGYVKPVGHELGMRRKQSGKSLRLAKKVNEETRTSCA